MKHVFRKGMLLIPFCLLAVMVNAQNYADLSPEVKQKIDRNKAEGKHLYAGMVRLLNLEVESCGSEEKALETLSILKDLDISYRVEYISPGRVIIHVNAENDYTRVRDFLFDRKIVVKNYYGEEIRLKK